jgi:tetratricopeptide (TPR) repeat protein
MHRQLFMTIVLTSLLNLPATFAYPQTASSKAFVTVLPLPVRDISPPLEDQILASVARQIRAQYSVRVLSGRAVGRSVWGTLGSGLEEASMRFNSKVSEGRQAYQTLQIGRSLKAMREAEKYLEFCGPEVRDGKLLVDSKLYAGLSLLAQGARDEALNEFRQAVAYDNDYQLSERKFPPDVIQAFNAARQQLLSGNPTQVTFISKPAGATVYVDGHSRGVTPLRGLKLYTGRHFIRLEQEGYSAWTLNLPDGIPPVQIKALMVPLWSGDAPEDLLGAAIANEQLSEPVLAQLRLLAGFFRADALVLISISHEGRDYHVGTRLFVVRPETISRARLFNLGSDRDAFEHKIRGVISTMRALRKIAGRPGVATNIAPVEHHDFLPAEHSSSNDTRSETGGGRTKWYTSWWFWTAVGVAAAGAATGLSLWLLRPESHWTLVVQPN